MGVYENVIKIIEEKHLTKNKVETLAGLSNGTIAGWEQGKPKLESVAKVAKVLEVKIDELIES